MRLPIPPPPRSGETYFFPGVGVAGAAGAGATGTGADGKVRGTVVEFAGAGACTGADFGKVVVFGELSSTDVPSPAFLVANIDNDSDVTMNSTADMVVALESRVADPRGPKAVCEPIPPNAPARSAALPLCSKTTTIKNKHTIT